MHAAQGISGNVFPDINARASDSHLLRHPFPSVSAPTAFAVRTLGSSILPRRRTVPQSVTKIVIAKDLSWLPPPTPISEIGPASFTTATPVVPKVSMTSKKGRERANGSGEYTHLNPLTLNVQFSIEPNPMISPVSNSLELRRRARQLHYWTSR